MKKIFLLGIFLLLFIACDFDAQFGRRARFYEEDAIITEVFFDVTTSYSKGVTRSYYKGLVTLQLSNGDFSEAYLYRCEADIVDEFYRVEGKSGMTMGYLSNLNNSELTAMCRIHKITGYVWKDPHPGRTAILVTMPLMVVVFVVLFYLVIFPIFVRPYFILLYVVWSRGSPLMYSGFRSRFNERIN